jgi:hypothetical protein
VLFRLLLAGARSLKPLLSCMLRRSLCFLEVPRCARDALAPSHVGSSPHLQSMWDYETQSLKAINFNLEGTPQSPSNLPQLLRFLQAQAYRSTCDASDVLTDFGSNLSRKLQDHVASKKGHG